MSRRKSTLGTKQKILEVASIAFSQKGFRATTIADICRLAGTNIASVNYYFGDKESLYVESWREAFRQSQIRHPLDGGVAEDASAEEKFRGWVTSMLRRACDPESYDFEIAHKEFTNPTGLLFEVIKESISPSRENLKNILGEILGKEATEEDIQLCHMSVHAQCMNPIIFQKRHKGIKKDSPFPEFPFPDVSIETIADHIIQFSLKGMQGGYLEARKKTEQTI